MLTLQSGCAWSLLHYGTSPLPAMRGSHHLAPPCGPGSSPSHRLSSCSPCGSGRINRKEYIFMMNLLTAFPSIRVIFLKRLSSHQIGSHSDTTVQLVTCTECLKKGNQKRFQFFFPQFTFVSLPAIESVRIGEDCSARV